MYVNETGITFYVENVFGVADRIIMMIFIYSLLRNDTESNIVLFLTLTLFFGQLKDTIRRLSYK